MHTFRKLMYAFLSVYYVRLGVTLLSVFLVFGCATYYQKNLKFQEFFTDYKFKEAEKYLEGKKKEAKGHNKILHFMNLGIVERMMEKYDESNVDLNQVDLWIEDFQKNAGLEALTYFTNPKITPYQAEDFESVLVNYFKALNYIALGNLEGARVEIRRMNIRLDYINTNRKEKITYREDAFSHLVSGMLYEANGEVNDAFIAYRNALNVYKDLYGKAYKVSVPEQLKKDILRTAYQLKFSEELNQYQSEFGFKYNPKDNPRGNGDLVFLWHNGLGPVKAEWALSFTIIPGTGGAVTFRNDDLDMVIPFPAGSVGKEENQNLANLRIVRVVIPKFVEREPMYQSGAIRVDGQKHSLQLGENINAIAFQDLRDHMMRELTKTLIRVAIKQAAAEAARAKNKEGLGLALNLLGAITESADTRNWQTLPHSIYYARVSLPPGEHEVTLEANAGGGNVREFKVTANIQAGRTTFKEFNTLESVTAPSPGAFGANY